MKKELFSSIVFVLGIFLMAACGEKDGATDPDSVTDPDNLTIIESHLDFTALGGKGTVVVEANKPMEASSKQDWVSIGTEGNIITVDVSMNNTISERTAIITITAGEATESVTVTQWIAVLEVSSSFSPIIFMEQGGRQAIEVQTNLKGQYQVQIEDDWLTYHIEGDSLILTAPSSELKREAKVNLTLCGRTVGIAVKQVNITGYYILNSIDFGK